MGDILTPLDGSGDAERAAGAMAPFAARLARHSLELTRGETKTLQINVGLRCNQICRHCHLEAGPHRTEVMDRTTMKEVILFVERNPVQVVDITGGAPEMNPDLEYMIEKLSPRVPRLMVRSNLTALGESGAGRIMEVCRSNRVVVVASLPSLHPSQVEAQRGRGVMERSIAILQKLNRMGYGRDGTGLELNLVSNPTGAFLPLSQTQAEQKFRRDLERIWGISFDHLYAFANAPLGRFRTWLVESGNFQQYMGRLVSGFNPCTVEGLMCRTLLSVSWDGFLYDCDFNLARGLFMGGHKVHISEMDGLPKPGSPIAVSDHCYACTVGSGFT